MLFLQVGVLTTHSPARAPSDTLSESISPSLLLTTLWIPSSLWWITSVVPFSTFHPTYSPPSHQSTLLKHKSDHINSPTPIKTLHWLPEYLEIRPRDNCDTMWFSHFTLSPPSSAILPVPRALYLSGSQLGGFCPPGNIWPWLDTFFGCQRWMGITSIYLVCKESRHATKILPYTRKPPTT